VLVVVLLGVAALAGLTFYVYNAGAQINRRLEMQDAADAVARSGAAWMARSMNNVAMNNVAQARMLALVPVLDALILSTDIAFSELDEWIGDNAYGSTEGRPIRGLTYMVQGLEGPISELDRESREKIRAGLKAILGRLKRQRAILAPIRELAGTIERATNWSIRGVGGVPPHGHLWRAAAALDAYSESIVASAGLLAQANAVRFGRENGCDAAFVVPVMPQLPAVRGKFEDFQHVLRKRLSVNLEAGNASVAKTLGSVGGAIPNPVWPYRLGPWARFFEHPGWYPNFARLGGKRGWREAMRRRILRGYGPKRTIVIEPREGRKIIGPSAGGGRAGSPASRGYGHRAGQVVERADPIYEEEVIGYKTFGPYHWAKKWVIDYASRSFAQGRANLGDTRFVEYFNKNAETKLKYMFSLNPKIEEMHRPQWRTDLAEAVRIAEDPLSRITLTKYYYIEVIYKTKGATKTVTSHNLSNPVTKEFSGWAAPEELRSKVFGNSPDVSEALKLGSLPMWKFTAQGKEVLYRPDGSVKEEWPLEFVWYFIFGGIDVGGTSKITNPCERDPLDRMPAPWVLNPGAIARYTPDPDFADYKKFPRSKRRDNFAFLGIVRKETRAPFWSAMFSSHNPLESIVAVAQAKVLNNQSWDLWTQDWQAQLTSVKLWEEWVDRADEGIGQAGSTGGLVSPDEVERMRDYMHNLGGYMAEDYLTH
jgi:hypothetical protein